jgi:hypothetical protein
MSDTTDDDRRTPPIDEPLANEDQVDDALYGYHLRSNRTADHDEAGR